MTGHSKHTSVTTAAAQSIPVPMITSHTALITKARHRLLPRIVKAGVWALFRGLEPHTHTHTLPCKGGRPGACFHTITQHDTTNICAHTHTQTTPPPPGPHAQACATHIKHKHMTLARTYTDTRTQARARACSTHKYNILKIHTHTKHTHTQNTAQTHITRLNEGVPDTLRDISCGKELVAGFEQTKYYLLQRLTNPGYKQGPYSGPYSMGKLALPPGEFLVTSPSTWPRRCRSISWASGCQELLGSKSCRARPWTPFGPKNQRDTKHVGSPPSTRSQRPQNR